MYVCVFKWACEPVHVSMNVQSEASGLHRDLVNSEHFCPCKASLGLNVPVQVYADVGNHGCVPGSGAGISSTLRINSDPRKALSA